MFREIFVFEVQNALRKPAFYIYFGIFFLLNLFTGMAVAGVFDTSSSDTFQVFNSAYAVAGILLGTGILFSLLISIMVISIVATAIQKDYQFNIHMFFFTKPINKAQYFFGRFLGVFFMASIVISGMVVGYYVGTLFGMGTPAMGPFTFMNFFQPYLIFSLPNLFVFSVLFFSLTTFTRSTMASYILALILMVLQFGMDSFSADLEKKDIAALLDPTGSLAFTLVTEYWTPFEKNQKLIPFSGKLMQNRLLWIGIAGIICAISYFRFQFSQFLEPFSLFKRKAGSSQTENPPAIFSLADIPPVAQDFSKKGNWKQLWWITKLELTKIYRSPFFLILCGLIIGVILLILYVRESTLVESSYLVTYTMVEILSGAIGFFLIIFIIFYSGTSLWREREVKMDEMAGASPAPNSIFFCSKMLSLLIAVGIVYVLAAIAGIFIQLYQGVFNIHPGQYLVFILAGLARQMVLIGFCLAVQTYVGNKFLGFFLCLLPVVILPIVFGLLEWSSDLVEFNSSGVGISWSDIKGYGGAFATWYFFRGYWYSIVALFILLAIVVYPRGKEKKLQKRWKLSSAILTTPYKSAIYGSLFAILAFGGFIYYQNRVLIPYSSPKEAEEKTAEMEKKYGRYRNLLQPRIAGVSIAVDFFTDKRSFNAKGNYLLINKTQQPIDTLYLEYFGGKKSPYTYPVFAPAVAFKQVVNDTLHGVKIVKLSNSLLPGDSLLLNFEMQYQPRGIFDKVNSPIESNGTFINYGYLPTIGYNPDGELSENRARKKYGLAPKPMLPKANDTVAMRNNILSYNSDWITFEAILSTDDGQIAVAPGYLEKEWEKNGRRYFSYKMDSPMMHFYSMLSGNYQVKKDKWNAVNIEIYYQKGHEYNLDRMVNAIKKSLDYYTKNFGPYQHKQVRILEFPRDRSFAQSFPNTIPFSESIGFISKVKNEPDAIDLPFYVTAHEVAHQWWGHQVAEAKVQGSAMLSESMSQYSALMVMEKEYGAEAMKKFLKKEMNSYLLGRTTEGKGENPLMYCENQQYIHYNKGSVVFYALKDLIGEDNLNRAIRAYVDSFKFKGPLYANTPALVAQIKQVTPDSLRYAITDMMEKITLHENYVKNLSFKELQDKTYEVTVTVGAAKFVADSTGKQQKVKVFDLMDIAVFKKNPDSKGAKELPLVIQKVWMDAPEKTFTFRVKEKPFSAGLDPYLKLIDRTPDNNTAEFGKTPKLPNLSEDAPPAVQFTF